MEGRQVDQWKDLERGALRLQTNKVTHGPRKGEVVLTPAYENGEVNTAAMQYLAVHRGEPTGTRQRRFDAITHLHAAADVLGIPGFERRLSYDGGLRREELDAIDDAFRAQLAPLRDLAERIRAGVSVMNVQASITKLPALAVSTEIARKVALIQYLEWLMETGDAALTRYVVSEKTISARREAFAEIRSRIRVPKKSSGRRLSRFSSTDLARLKDAVTSHDSRKIWASQFVALRNQVIIDLMFYGGLRKSEVLLLYKSDIIPPRAGGTIEVRVKDRRNDPSDPRKPAPATKTGSGVSTLPDFAYKRLEAYQEACLDIEDQAYDRGLAENLKHNFLIIGGAANVPRSFGAPLSTSGLRAAWEQFLKGVGLEEFHAGRLSPHALRHLCAIEYVRRRRAQGSSDEAIQEDMKPFFRWSPTSEMPAYYTSTQINADLYAHDLRVGEAQSIDNKFLNEI